MDTDDRVSGSKRRLCEMPLSAAQYKHSIAPSRNLTSGYKDSDLVAREVSTFDSLLFSGLISISLT